MGRLFRALRAEAGISALETGVTLTGFVLVASVFGGIVMSTGIRSSDQLEQTVFSALERTNAGLELRGPVLVRTEGGQANVMLITVGTAVGSTSVHIDPAAPAGRMVVAYIDDEVSVNDLPYTVNWISGDADSLLEPGEMAELALDLSSIAPPIANNRTLIVELRFPQGAALVIERTMPVGSSLDPLVNLH